MSIRYRYRGGKFKASGSYKKESKRGLGLGLIDSYALKGMPPVTPVTETVEYRVQYVGNFQGEAGQFEFTSDRPNTGNTLLSEVVNSQKEMIYFSQDDNEFSVYEYEGDKPKLYRMKSLATGMGS